MQAVRAAVAGGVGGSGTGTEAREQLTETLQPHTTTEALDQFGEWIIECESAEELLQRIRAGSNGIS